MMRFSKSFLSCITYVYIKFLNDSANMTWKISLVAPTHSAGRSHINKTTQAIQKYVEFSMGECRSMNTQNTSLSPCCRAFSSQSDDTSVKPSESLATVTDSKCLLALVSLSRNPVCLPATLCGPRFHKKFLAPKQGTLKLGPTLQQRDQH